jgi:hypothetical protein
MNHPVTYVAPTSWHIALARCILQQKPLGMSIRGMSTQSHRCCSLIIHLDYIRNLRRALTDEPKRVAIEYLDGMTYWKDLFQKSQFEIHELQNKVAGLAMEVESLKKLEKCSPKRKAQAVLEPERRNTRRRLSSTGLDLHQDEPVACGKWESLSDNGQSVGMPEFLV